MHRAMRVTALLGMMVSMAWGSRLDPAPVPEPATLLLMGGGLGVMALAARRWRKK